MEHDDFHDPDSDNDEWIPSIKVEELHPISRHEKVVKKPTNKKSIAKGPADPLSCQICNVRLSSVTSLKRHIAR